MCMGGYGSQKVINFININIVWSEAQFVVFLIYKLRIPSVSLWMFFLDFARLFNR